MPVAIELKLRAGWAVRPDTRQLHGLACALFEGEGADHLGQDKPFSIWPLRQAPPGAAHDWELHAAWLRPGPPPATVLTPETLRLGHVTCTVTESAHRSVSHAQIAAGPPLAAVDVTFHSPVFFTQNGTDTVVPDPRLIAGSWRRRWNTSLTDADKDTLEIDDGIWRETHRAIQLASFDLRTRREDSGRGRERAGFTGTAVLRLTREAPRPVRIVFGTLARFAEFCGTGAQTTHGFGATTVA
jgi:hypothetical protein